MSTLTQERLKQVLYYEPETGVFTWIADPRVGPKRKGSEAGTGRAHPNGYRQITVDQRSYYAHRLAWLYMTGAWPNDEMDHINGEKSDNSLANLREADSSTNKQNRRLAYRNNKIGLLGVTKHRGRFRATIRVDGHYKFLGLYSSPAEAQAAYVKAKRAFHPWNTL